MSLSILWKIPHHGSNIRPNTIVTMVDQCIDTHIDDFRPHRVRVVTNYLATKYIVCIEKPTKSTDMKISMENPPQT